ncbi:MAG: three-helix bundle dimerization domain-containing protein [Actinomycetes bacterium]
MTEEPEARALMAIIDRLAARFPHEQRSVIEDVVAEEHALLDDGPIRDYVPVLVERAAKLRLAHSQPDRLGQVAPAGGTIGV